MGFFYTDAQRDKDWEANVQSPSLFRSFKMAVSANYRTPFLPVIAMVTAGIAAYAISGGLALLPVVLGAIAANVGFTGVLGLGLYGFAHLERSGRKNTL